MPHRSGSDQSILAGCQGQLQDSIESRSLPHILCTLPCRSLDSRVESLLIR